MFDLHDRAFLLRQRGIGEGVLVGLEAMGGGSVADLVALGADELCMRMRAVNGQDVWRNRRRALKAAIDAAVASGLCCSSSAFLRSVPGRAFANCSGPGDSIDSHA